MRANTKISTLIKMRSALELAGVRFIDEGATSDEGGPGVRLRGRMLTPEEIAELQRKTEEASPYYRRAFAHLRPKT